MKPALVWTVSTTLATTGKATLRVTSATEGGSASRATGSTNPAMRARTNDGLEDPTVKRKVVGPDRQYRRCTTPQTSLWTPDRESSGSGGTMRSSMRLEDPAQLPLLQAARVKRPNLSRIPESLHQGHAGCRLAAKRQVGLWVQALLETAGQNPCFHGSQHRFQRVHR
eukprot:2792749-Amphidinium_carterae.1